MALSVSFHNQPRDFDPTRNFYVRALGLRHRVAVESAGRDLQISSVFGRTPLPRIPGHRPLRVWSSGEARDPTAQVFDIHFGFAPRSILGPQRWHRFPLWVRQIGWFDPDSRYAPERLLAPRQPTSRPRFCNFIYANDVSIRAEFFFRLNRRRPVDSLGPVLNNRGALLPGGPSGKVAALREYLFTIAFENQIAPGYVTEKLIQPLMAGSIPIYWGAREALSDFNPDAFIYAPDFADLDSLVEHVLAVADDKTRLKAMATASIFRDNRIPYEHTPDFFLDRVEEAMASELRAEIPDDWSSRPFLGRGLKQRKSRFREAKRAVRKLGVRLRRPFG
jgi:hypothetical protein